MDHIVIKPLKPRSKRLHAVLSGRKGGRMQDPRHPSRAKRKQQELRDHT